VPISVASYRCHGPQAGANAQASQIILRPRMGSEIMFEESE
jgi:hypothetical protein